MTNLTKAVHKPIIISMYKPRYNKTTVSEKLRLDRAALIRGLIENGQSQSDIAEMLGISRQAINQIINRHKVTARRKLQYALHMGYITKPSKCDVCGIETKIEAHHNDYGLPTEVDWLCRKCHMLRHTI